MTGAATPGWRPTVACTVAIATAATLLFLAVALHRRDLLALAAPVCAGLLIDISGRRARQVSASLRVDRSTLLEDQETTLRLCIEADGQLDLVASAVLASPLFTAPGQSPRLRPRCDPMPATGALIVGYQLRATRWGRRGSGAATVTVSSWHCMLQTQVVPPQARVKVVPLRDQFAAVDSAPVAAGIIGAHRSRRPGEGGDFAGIRPFAPGDRLKRINWPVSLRTGALHVTATMSDRDTAVMLVLDTSIDVGATDGTGSLDTAVRAAASIAEHYLHSGDRVGLIDHARPLLPIRPAAGRSHLNRILDVLVDVTPQPGLNTPIARILAQVAPRAMVVLLSPLIGAATRDRAVAIARTGRTVLVVDTLPNEVAPGPRHEWSDLARRLLLLQRDMDIARLTELGVPVVAWRGAGSLDTVLHGLNRAATAGRVHR